VDRREFYKIADLSALIAHLDIAPIVEAQTWQEWHIGPISGGASRLKTTMSSISREQSSI
jgi:hypothetical protein